MDNIIHKCIQHRKKIIPAILVMAFVVIFTIDYFFVIEGGVENSISAWIIELSYHQPIVQFLIGLLYGHFFWRIKLKKRTKSHGRLKIL